MDQAFVPEKTSKLVIRVKMDASSNPSVSKDQETETEFNPVAIGVLVFVVLLLAGVAYYFLNSSTSNVPPEFEVQTSESTENIPQALIEEPVITEPPAIEPVLAVAVLEQQKLAEEPEPIKNLEVSPVQESVVSAPVEVELPAEQKVEELSLTKNVPLEVAEVKAPVEVKSESAIVKVNEFSANIKRAQFTNDINKREPVDKVEGVLDAKAEGLKRIYFFTELVKLKGQTIRHQWIHEGKLQSELKFKVGGNRWRVNSSKRLNPAAVGDWQVNVLNEQDEVLISKNFEYKLP